MKKQFLLKIVLSFICLVLMSCSKSPMVPLPYKNVGECKLACAHQAQLCFNQCQNNCSHCVKSRAKNTAKSYNRYLNEQKVKGKVVALDLNSFSDPLQCRKMTCNCNADYSVCMQSCGGLIYKSLQVTPLCG